MELWGMYDILYKGFEYFLGFLFILLYLAWMHHYAKLSCGRASWAPKLTATFGVSAPILIVVAVFTAPGPLTTPLVLASVASGVVTAILAAYTDFKC